MICKGEFVTSKHKTRLGEITYVLYDDIETVRVRRDR